MHNDENAVVVHFLLHIVEKEGIINKIFGDKLHKYYGILL